jgi:hypothetical protein
MAALFICWESIAQLSWHNFVFNQRATFDNIDPEVIKLKNYRSLKIYCSTVSSGEYNKDRKRAEERFNLPRNFLQATVFFDTNGYSTFYHDTCNYYPGTVALSSDTVVFQDSIFETYQYNAEGFLEVKDKFRTGRLVSHNSYTHKKNGLDRKGVHKSWSKYKKKYSTWVGRYHYNKYNLLQWESEDGKIVARNTYKKLNDSTLFRIEKNGIQYLREYFLYKIDTSGNVISIYKLKEGEQIAVKKTKKGLGGYPRNFYAYNSEGKIIRSVTFMNIAFSDLQNWNHKESVYSYNDNNRLEEVRNYEGWHSYSGRYEDDYRQPATESKLREIEKLYYDQDGLLIKRTLENLDFNITYAWTYEYD